jgi:hypothetical protein
MDDRNCLGCGWRLCRGVTSNSKPEVRSVLSLSQLTRMDAFAKNEA